MPDIIFGKNYEELGVACFDGNARIFTFNTMYNLRNSKDGIRVLSRLYGPELFRILTDETGFVRYEDNKFALKVFIERDTKRTVMRMMGKIAEAVIVRRCRDDELINLKWLRIACRKQVRMETARKSEAMGTGLEGMKQRYSGRYNPSDPQRDIVWNTGQGQRVQMKGSTATAGKEAGLQVKVSTDGIKYILDDLLRERYEVPLVYFDINRDYPAVADKVFEYRKQHGMETLSLEHDFIHAEAVDPAGMDEVRCYTALVDKLVKGEMSPDELIQEAENYPTMKNAALATMFESLPGDVYIYH